MRFLVAECEPPQAREKRRESVGRSSGETYLEVLHKLAPGAECDRIKPTDSCAEIPGREALTEYDAVFLTGSPLHLWQDSPEARRQIDFMHRVFASGTPSFGSCAGLQVACVAAGGKVRPMGDRREAGFARRLVATERGRAHPLLDGRPASYDAPAIHTDEVEALPEGATLLASNRVTRVQAAEIRCGEGVFWGVQYHPEISLREVAAALRRQSDDLLEHGLARSNADVEQLAQQVDALHAEPNRADLAWQLGLDDQVTVPEYRTRELRNFIEHLVKPTRAKRGR
ncbi:type 1 glutamine amidotransferase [Sphingomonas xinjiangensis]|uniref:GMP synthase (Glutamine-hydrolyzing) n=1 Tax=Sphingomonas xinjiangensis TaxID=643568 RepID=A0A840YH55_9SPHN|nr:type 1 glutamine amidotransferase [Sphingomonas xinjiangensis]MBB5711329.1 GMP synthase (glutamine-hydrolyzing) [Sphingomonas xinjiangensis]